MINSKAHAYINDFFYFVIMPYEDGDTKRLLYCSGINIYRFLPITRGRHRPMSNPVMRGLQLVNLEVRSIALSRRARPKTLKGNYCDGIVPLSDGWYKDIILFENAPVSLPEELINYCAINLVKKIAKAILLPITPPDKLLSPDEMQAYLEGLCKRFG